jgi:hypothetical protein
LPRQTLAQRLSIDDRTVLWDAIRFGALTFEQIARRYHSIGQRQLPQLDWLRRRGLLSKRPDWLSNTTFYVATPRAARVLNSPLTAITPKPLFLLHDLTLVNLADWLVERNPGATWRTERELRAAPRLNPGWGRPERPGHPPDGLLIVDQQCIGIELEFDFRDYAKYARVCRWFAAHIEYDGLHWYVGSGLLERRIPLIVAANALGPDLDIRVFRIPNEVEVLEWVR